ncbi:hypothetical protein Aperf_G00000016962 [Anoplocephala perfoliata]
MTFWTSVTNVSKLATSALKEAQRKLDKVLDIQEDVTQSDGQPPSSQAFIDFDGNAFMSSAEVNESVEAAVPKRDRQVSFSLSSSSMPESAEAIEVSLESTLHEQGRPSSTGAESPAQGDGYSSMDMSTSGTLAAEATARRDPLSTIEAEITSTKADEEVKESIVKEVDTSNENIPAITTSVVPSSLMKPRLDDESPGTTTSSEIEVISNCTSVYDDSVSHQNTVGPRGYLSVGPSDSTAYPDVPYQKFAEAIKLLEAREAKLVEICRTNHSLQEVNEFLHAKLEEAGLPHDFSPTDLQSLTDEFTERLANAEKKLQAVIHERDQLASASKSLEVNLKRTYGEQEKVLMSRCTQLRSALTEKEAQLADLLSEGNRMAQEQLKANNLVKTLRSKSKALESDKQKISNDLTKAQTEVEGLKSQVSLLRENENKLQESFNQVTHKNLKLEKEVSVLKADLESSKEKTEALDRMRLELESKLSESAEGLASTRAALSEAQTRGEAIRDVEEEQQSLRDEVSTLRARLEEARVSAARHKLESEQRLQQVRQEVEHYREQLAESESRFESLGETATSVAKPLLQQIKSLQSKLSDQNKTFESTEQGLLAQITDLKKRLETAQRTDRQFQDRLNETETAADALRRELALERENSGRLHDRLSQYNLQDSANKSQLEKLQSELDSLNHQIASLEDFRDSATSALSAEREEVSNLRAELVKTKAELAHALSSSSALTTIVAATSSPPSSRRNSELKPLAIPSVVSFL